MKSGRFPKNNDFELLARQIETATDVLRQDALVVINRSVTARAWLTGYYIVEYEQHGKDRAEYGEKLLSRLSTRLGTKDYSVHTLKKHREFYRVFPELASSIAAYLAERFGKGYSPIIQLPVTENPPVEIGYSPNIQSDRLFLEENDGADVRISPRALRVFRFGISNICGRLLKLGPIANLCNRLLHKYRGATMSCFLIVLKTLNGARPTPAWRPKTAGRVRLLCARSPITQRRTSDARPITLR